MHFKTSQFAAWATIPLLTSAAPSSLEARQGQSITVDLSKTYQTIDGFGFSGAFQRANLIVNLNEPKQTEVLDLLFNKTTGAGLTIVRNGIGSSKDSSRDYMNTILPNCPSSPSGEKNYQWDGKDSGQLFLSQSAMKYGVDKFYANAWSAPGCMKTNGNDANGGKLCGLPGTNCRSGDWRQAYADYLVRYIQFYAEEGVQITHLGFLNEPDFSTSYASMLSNGAEAANFIKILRPTLDAANLTSVGINCCEATGWNVANQHAQQIASAGAMDMVYAITSHEYTSRINGPVRTNPTPRAWQTEWSDLNGRWSTQWYSYGGPGDGFTWANNIHNGLVSANLSAYLFWEGIQDRATNNNNNEKLILVDGQNYEVSKRLWAFAGWSRVVRPGAVRVGTSGGNNARVAAFRNTDGSVAVVVINQGGGGMNVNVGGVGEGVQGVGAWITDNERAMEEVQGLEVAGDGSVGVSLPARGMVSMLFIVGSGGAK